jgi:hypothetical protein
VVVILAFMPGLIFIRGYFRFPFPRTFTTTDEIVAAMVFAVPLQALGIWIVQACTAYRIDFIDLGTLMEGAKSDLANADAFKEVSRFLWPIIGYNVALWVFANRLGNVLRQIVIRTEWDLKYSWLRFSSEWYYLLTGRQWGWKAGKDFDLVFADVMVTFAPQSVIYSGILRSIHFARDGGVESLVLNQAEKWSHPDERSAQRIPGQAFVIKFDQVLNLNFRLIKMVAASAPAK